MLYGVSEAHAMLSIDLRQWRVYSLSVLTGLVLNRVRSPRWVLRSAEWQRWLVFQGWSFGEGARRFRAICQATDRSGDVDHRTSSRNFDPSVLLVAGTLVGPPRFRRSIKYNYPRS